jgi:hypothetical protein
MEAQRSMATGRMRRAKSSTALGLEEDDDGDKENGAQDVPENDAFDGGANNEVSHAFSLTETVGGLRVIVQESLPYDD